ncbi:uncharacterized protein LOC128184681 [Crassostrea angulata]|uniref:uncharacterized protein LOC128184681 n=1 Tax=Magallana angulata TaxID=2784310 RepID=UPI0022B1BA46|nr:uncharacterized protein LOC128184681 [Crassostrea angulata]
MLSDIGEDVSQSDPGPSNQTIANARPAVRAAAAVRTVSSPNTCPATRRTLSNIVQSGKDVRQSDPGSSNQSVANAPVLNTIAAEVQHPAVAEQQGGEYKG